ncbi:ActR/PrrA/RegA family redox response regulator transcription factor [Kordiimonas sp.]|uniref:ActR/PrrA/RegA family redox response regulator transcription factor n=1 Tax=Kordiimonas sp. TaxID=1970157 RepID=UPI003A9284FB
MTETATQALEKTLLIVEDDKSFRNRLTISMERRGFKVFAAEGVEEGAILAAQNKPRYAVLDMKLQDGNGLDLVPSLRQMRTDMRIIILTGYGNLASAVAAVKAGAVDFLAKPADPDQIAAALLTPEGQTPPLPDNPMSADRVKWEHIQRVYEMCDRNVSETARRLNMHRRTLQRILAKHSPQ